MVETVLWNAFKTELVGGKGKQQLAKTGNEIFFSIQKTQTKQHPGGGESNLGLRINCVDKRRDGLAKPERV